MNFKEIIDSVIAVSNYVTVRLASILGTAWLLFILFPALLPKLYGLLSDNINVVSTSENLRKDLEFWGVNDLAPFLAVFVFLSMLHAHQTIIEKIGSLVPPHLAWDSSLPFDRRWMGIYEAAIPPSWRRRSPHWIMVKLKHDFDSALSNCKVRRSNYYLHQFRTATSAFGMAKFYAALALASMFFPGVVMSVAIAIFVQASLVAVVCVAWAAHVKRRGEETILHDVLEGIKRAHMEEYFQEKDQDGIPKLRNLVPENYVKPAAWQIGLSIPFVGEFLPLKLSRHGSRRR